MRRLLLVTLIFSLYATAAHAAPLVREGTAANTAGLLPTVDQFRADLGGPLQPNNGQTFETGRREINWDGVPDQFSAPNAFPPDFFNKNSPRGVVFSTPGSGFQTSSTAVSGVPVRFGNINPAYTSAFSNFSFQRLFTPIGSNVTTVDFFVPGKTDPLGVKGFGAVFSDVDQAGSARIEFFDADGNLLLDRAAPAAPGTATLSFLGATFDGETPVHHVRITAGTAPLAAGTTDSGGTDVVALDDFIYGEPRDADGVGVDDNCPGVANPDQKDTDGDKKGDACDTDDDNDGTLDASDAFPLDGSETVDLDGDGIGDNRDEDLDGDGVSNADEVARGTDARKGDTDGDGAGDRTDNCPVAPNPDQADGDADGRGDACDSPTVAKLALKRARKGFKVSYLLSEPATLRFTVEKKKNGAWKPLKGQFLKKGKSGANAFGFSGKLNRKLLGPGTYRLVAEATDSANEKSAVVRKGFKVKKRR